VCDLVYEARHFARGKELDKESFDELILCGNGFGWQRMKPHPQLIPKRERKQA